MTRDSLRIDRAVTGGGEVLPGAPTLLLVHGFLDDATVWDGFVRALGGAVATARVDLPGSGTRASVPVDTEKLSLALFADEIASVVDDIEGPVVLVGQSMGAQVAELAAAARPERVAGLVLLTPVPLGGTRLPDEAVEPFRALGGNPEAQRAVRTQLSPALDNEALDTLGRIGLLVAPPVAARYVDLWNNGVDAAPEQSAYPGPVLIVRGDSDGFATEELVNGVVTPRFPGVLQAAVPGGGHWLHVEHPRVLAHEVLGFLRNLHADEAASGWRSGFSEQSESTFSEGFAEDVALEASVLARPIVGRALVASTLAAASAIYESLEFTAEATDGTTTYLQWKATAFGGVEISGVTVLEKNTDGQVVRAAIHHRPLGAALRFSATIRDRLVGIVSPDHFYAGDPQAAEGA